MTGRVEDKIGITEKRRSEMTSRLNEIIKGAKQPRLSTSDLIKLIAQESSFTREECVYLGIVLVATYQRDDPS